MQQCHIEALAREHGVSRGAIRTAVADLLPNQPQRPPAATVVAPELLRVEIPGKHAQHLHAHDDLGQAERRAPRQGRTVRRGQGYSLHVTTRARGPLGAAAALTTDDASSADRKAYRLYEQRLNTMTQAILTPPS